MSTEAEDEPGLPELLFSLASDDRLALLAELNSRRQRLTPLSRVIKATVQECSRHLERLNESGLVAKDSDGFYATTSLGRSVLRMFPGVKFLLTNREYFLSHDPGYLPDQFIERLGELSAGNYTDHVSQTLELIKTIISEAREYVWLVADQPPIVSRVAGGSFSSRDIPVKFIFEVADKRVVTDVRAALTHAELAQMKGVRVAMAVNEKMAGICLPDLKGRADFSAGFSGTDSRLTTWCRDLFQHYWTESRKPGF